MDWSSIPWMKSLFSAEFFIILGLALSFGVVLSLSKLLVLRILGKGKIFPLQTWQIVVLDIAAFVVLIVLYEML
jgi:hypothetical protein